jgi:hypothetical protein
MYEQLKMLRDKLVANGAQAATLAFVDLRIREAAAVVEPPNAPRVPETMIIRHLNRRNDVRGSDIEVDLLNLLPEDDAKPRVELEEQDYHPKPHSFYKKQKKQ